MAAAWRTKGKSFADKQVIYRYMDGDCLQYEVAVDGGGASPVRRAWAEHEVCSGNARYVNGRVPHG